MSYIGAKPAEQILSSADIQDGSIATADLANASVTQAKLASGVAGSGPAFSAYQASAQSVANATFTKITFDTETFDTNNNFTSSRFTPTVAGYYQINLTTSIQTAIATLGALYKNGSAYIYVVTAGITAVANTLGTISCIVYMNGSTDYLEGYVYQNSGVSLNSFNNSAFMQFSGSLIRSA